MVPTPTAVGLTLCHQVIVEEGTRNITLINAFATFKASTFPSTPRPFCVLATLIDGAGDGTIELVITREETEQVIYTKRYSGHFPNRLVEMRALFRVGDCAFPAAGLYYATLLVDGEWVAHKRFRVSLLGGSS